MAKLKGKIALIAGGAWDINLLVAKQFIQEGAHVFIMGRHEADLAAALEQVGSSVTGVQGDASNIADLDRLFAQIEREKGKIDIVFANADAAEVATVKREHLPRVHRITRSLETAAAFDAAIHIGCLYPGDHTGETCSAGSSAVIGFSSEAVGVSGKFACAHGIWEHQTLGTLRER